MQNVQGAKGDRGERGERGVKGDKDIQGDNSDVLVALTEHLPNVLYQVPCIRG